MVTEEINLATEKQSHAGPMTTEYDVLVIGCGPAGERAAIHAARAGRRVAVIERSPVVGGARINWGTIPSKTLRESALYVLSLTRFKLHGIRLEMADEITVQDFMHREKAVVQRELELINRSLDRYRIEVIEGHARFLDTHHVRVERPGQEPLRLRGEVIIIASGSAPNRPADVPFDDACVFDSNTILALPRMPRDMIVLGAGVIGIEYASIFAALGIRVNLVDTRDRLLPYLDREMVAILRHEMERLGICITHEDRYASIERLPGLMPRVRVRSRRQQVWEADVLLYCVGRDGNTRDLGLEHIGLAANAYGLLAVDQHFQTIHPNIYAVGDVIGYPALASTSMEQGRQAIRHALQIEGLQLRTDVLPFAIYSIPEVSYIGATEEELLARNQAYVVGRAQCGMNPRGQIVGDTSGMLKLLFEVPGGRLLGAHMVGHGASELIHIGQAFLNMQATAAQVAETLFNYPSLADMYRHAALEAATQLRRLEAAARNGTVT